MLFYDNKIALTATFLKSNKTYEFEYNSLKGVYRIFATRGGSFLYFSISDDVYEKGKLIAKLNASVISQTGADSKQYPCVEVKLASP